MCLYFTGPFLSVYSSCFAFNRPSHVCLYLYFRAAATSPDEALIVVASIAIWNRNKLAVRISLGVWGCNVAFLVQGKLLLFNRSGISCLTQFGNLPGAARVSSILIIFGFVGLSDGSFALDGYQRVLPVCLRRQSPANPPSSLCSLLTSPCFSSCSLACSACAIAMVTCLV